MEITPRYGRSSLKALLRVQTRVDNLSREIAEAIDAIKLEYEEEFADSASEWAYDAHVNGQSSRPIAQANEDRFRLRRQRYVEQQAKRKAVSSSEHVASGSQRRIRRKVMEMVDKLKSLSSESVEYESKILTRFLKHSSISKALKVGSIMSLKEQHAVKLLLANLATGLQTMKSTHTQDDMIHDDCKEMGREMGWGETAELAELVLN
ncbi:hypothetical protein R1sor_015256 [Riccia sorocarpa]|uniref:Uncharacterized protein n=1 Tax=Riccia sorocarpa TaxID=122646 RepID=A0ABD3HER1_9MARC